MSNLQLAILTPWKTRCGIYDYSRDLSNALVQQDIDIHIVRVPRLGVLTPELMQNVADSIPLDKIDLIHVQHEYGIYQSLEGGFFTSLERMRKPIVTTMHTTGVKWDVDRVISEVSNKVIVHNKFMAEKHDRPCEIIPHGCLPPQRKPERQQCRDAMGIMGNAPNIGYCGFISPMKGLEVLLDAMEKVEHASLMVAGGWFVEQETAYITRLKQWSLKTLQNRCVWTGYIEDQKLPYAYGAMDFVVYPSRFASESGALLKALSFGKAVISTDIKPFKEKIPTIMTFKDANDLVDKMKNLLKNKDLVAEYEEKARKYVLKNSWANIAQQHIKLYKKVINQ